MGANRDDLRRQYAVDIFASMLPLYQDQLQKDTKDNAQKLADGLKAALGKVSLKK